MTKPPDAATAMLTFTAQLVRDLLDVDHDQAVTMEVTERAKTLHVSIDASPSIAALLTGVGGRTRTALEHVLGAAADALGARGCALRVSDGAPDPAPSCPHAPVRNGCESFVLSIAAALFGHRDATLACQASGEDRGRPVLVISCPAPLRGGLIGTRGLTISAIETLTRAYARAHDMTPPIVRVLRDDGSDGSRREPPRFTNVPRIVLRGRANAG